MDSFDLKHLATTQTALATTQQNVKTTKSNQPQSDRTDQGGHS